MAQELEESSAPPTKLWKCKTCQFVVASPRLPFRCPRCGASRVKFDEVTGRTSTG